MSAARQTPSGGGPAAAPAPVVPAAPVAPVRTASIQIKMVVAFLLVSLLPMMFAADLATRVVSAAFEKNVETWLRETSLYFVSNILDQQQEAVSIARYLSGQKDLVDTMVEGGQPPPAALRTLLSAMDYDLIAIYDGNKHFLYASTPVSRINRLPLVSDHSLFRIELPDRTLIMAAGIQRFAVAGKPYYFVLGTWLDENFLSNLQTITSLELRLYYRDGSGFREFYSSRSGAAPHQPLPGQVGKALLEGVPNLYDPDADHGRYRGMYSPLHDATGQVVGAIFCGLRSRETLSGWITPRNLFLSIFLTGTLLAVMAGSLVSRRLSRPLRQLAHGVRAIADGDFAQRVPVQGGDEVAELAGAVNQLAVKLGQLHELEAQLRRRDRLSALGEVAVGIAHEVRNPLGIIKTSAELVQKKGNLPPADARLLGYVIDEVRRIDGLIKNFLAFARPAPPVLAKTRAIDVIERVTRFAQPELARHDIILKLEDAAGDAVVLADENQLYQACLNLILNAVDAMAAGGTLAISLRSQGPNLLIAFADTGHGISPELKERIFNPFFTTKELGTGLGLAKVFAFMESHGGGVECESTPGHGAIFTLTLPLAVENSPHGAYHSSRR